MALWVESLAFGSFTVLYAIAIWILLYKERKRGSSTPNKRLFATATVMWLLSIAVCMSRARMAGRHSDLSPRMCSTWL